MTLLLGCPWNLFSLNCEQGVMWALTDMPVSQQLNGGMVLVGIGVALLFAFAAFD